MADGESSSDSTGIKLLKFLQSFGTYGMIVGAFMALGGLVNSEIHLLVVGIVGALLSLGWFLVFDRMIDKKRKSPTA